MRMASLAEEISDEWFKREGYFMIGGIRLRLNAIDLLAKKHRPEASRQF